MCPFQKKTYLCTFKISIDFNFYHSNRTIMKKIYLLLALACCTISSMATHVNVASYIELSAALGSGSTADTVVVESDITIQNPLSNTRSVVLDMAGHTFTMSAYFLPAADLTITGEGTFLANESLYMYMFSITNGGFNLTIENGTFDLSQNTSAHFLMISAEDSNTNNCIVTINGGYFETANQSVIHMQVNSEGTHQLIVNGGVFVNHHAYLGSFSDSGINKMTLTLNKAVLANANTSNSNIANMYASANNYLIPTGKKYVLDGQATSVSDATSINGMTGKVLYVGEDSYSEFSLFNLMGNNHASTHVYGITTGSSASGHFAHSAIFVTATPEVGYHGITFTTTPTQTLQVRDLGGDTYCIMPYTAGMSVSASSEPNRVSAIDITTKEGCIPSVGEHFWARKSTSTECSAIMSWPEGVYAGSASWYDESKSILQESSAVCEAGKTYYLYIKFYTETGWEWGPMPTATIDGKTASINGFHEVFYQYTTPSAPTGTEQAKTTMHATKILRNGQLLIERDSKTYDLTGRQH